MSIYVNNICLEQIATKRLYIELMYSYDKQGYIVNVYPQTSRAAKINGLNRSYIIRHELFAHLAFWMLRIIGGKEVKYEEEDEEEEK